MAKVASVDLIDNSAEVLQAMKEQVLLGLEAVGQEAEGYAKDETPVDTGRLRNSITHKVVEDENAVYVGTNVHYGIYLEYGTGIYADNGQGRKTPWSYEDNKGKWHTTRGMKPRHFLKKAVSDHANHFKEIMKAALKG